MNSRGCWNTETRKHENTKTMKNTQTAFHRLLDVLKRGDQSFLSKDMDAQSQVDGYRHMAHLLAYAMDFYLNSDPLRPEFTAFSSPEQKFLGDNVGSIYYFAPLQPDQTYRIRGRRFNSCYLSFALYGGKPDGSTSERVVDTINHRRIEFEDDGRFEILLTPDEPQGPNQFQLTPDSVTLFSREYFYDPATMQEAELEIENANPPAAPGPVTDEELARRFEAVANFVEQTLMFIPLPFPLPENGFTPPFPFPKDQRSWGLTDNIYCFGRFKLAEDEYLKIHFQSPECVYWGIQTWNFFMQSMDYRYHRVMINNGLATPNTDGTYTVIVSRRPTDAPNSLTTAGYEEGMVFCRWLLAEDLPEQPVMEVGRW